MKRIKEVCLFFIGLFFLSPVFAQTARTDSLLTELSKAKEDTNKVMQLRNVGNAIANQDPGKAIGYWQQGVTLSRKLNYVTGLSRTFINIGAGYSYLGSFDSAIVFYDSAIIYCKMINDPEKLALVYLNKGDAYRGLGDLRAALLNCDTARTYAEKTTNTDRQARIYTIISSIYIDQKQFANALPFLNKAIALYKKDGNNVMLGQSYDDFGIIYQQTGKLDSALIFRKMAISIAENEGDDKNLSTYYYGVADIYTDQQKYKEAEQYAANSLTYAEQQENNLQLGTAHILLCKIYLKQKKFDEAIKAGNRAWKFSLEEVQASLQYESAALLAEAYTGVGNYKEANHFLTISSDLKDSLNRQLFNQEVAGLQSSFELKEKDKEILLLNKDKELQQQRLFRQRILFGAAAALLLLSLLGIALLVNRNRLRQRMKELELRNQIAADLHDEVGSSLSSINMLSQMATSQNDTGVNQKNILEKVSSNAKETMDRMSDIVWMIKPGETEAGSLKQRMERFANEICGSKNIQLSLDLSAIENIKLTMAQRKNIYLIFKEAMNNAVKYSGTERIEVKSVIRNRKLELTVKDHGSGFETSLSGRGNGMDNMKNRARESGGTLAIDSNPGKGTDVVLTIQV
jgi:signal transduction histidine kinase